MLSHREHPNKTVICLIFKEIIMIHVTTELNRGWLKFHQSSIAPSMWLNFLPAFWHWHSWFSIITSWLNCGLLFVAWDSAMVWDTVFLRTESSGARAYIHFEPSHIKPWLPTSPGLVVMCRPCHFRVSVDPSGKMGPPHAVDRLCVWEMSPAHIQ